MPGRITELGALTGAAAATTDLIEAIDVSDTSMAATGTNKKLSLAELVVFVDANSTGGGAPPVGTKLSAFAALTGANAAGADIIEVVDVSDATMAASGTNKKMTLTELMTFLVTAGIVADNSITLAKMADNSVGTAEIVNGSVTNTELEPMPTLTIKGNNTGAGASPVDLTVAQAQTLLGITGAPLRRAVINNTATAFAPVIATHENTMVTLSNASPVVVTLPSDATSNFPIGAEIDFVWWGVGSCSFAQGASAVINSSATVPTAPVLRIRYAAATAKKMAANTWLVAGDLA